MTQKILQAFEEVAFSHLKDVILRSVKEMVSWFSILELNCVGVAAETCSG